MQPVPHSRRRKVTFSQVRVSSWRFRGGAYAPARDLGRYYFTVNKDLAVL